MPRNFCSTLGDPYREDVGSSRASNKTSAPSAVVGLEPPDDPSRCLISLALTLTLRLDLLGRPLRVRPLAGGGALTKSAKLETDDPPGKEACGLGFGGGGARTGRR